MLIRYIDPNTNCMVIQSFSDVHMEKTENSEHELTFVCDNSIFCVVCVFCQDYRNAVEYMNRIYDDGKIDFCNEDVRITIDGYDNEDSDFLDLLKDSIGIGNIDNFDDDFGVDVGNFGKFIN